MRALVRVKALGKRPITAALWASGYYGWRRRRLPEDRALVLVYHHVGEDGWAPFQRGVSAARFERQMRWLRRAMHPVPLRDVVAAVQGRRPLPPRAVAVTFDDGYLNNYTVALPALARHGIPATMFVTSGLIGTTRRFWWDDVYWLARSARGPRLEPAALVAAGIPDGTGALPLTSQAARLATAETLIERLRELPAERRLAGIARLGETLGAEGPPQGPAMMTWEQLREMRGHDVEVQSHTHTHPILGQCDAQTVEEELATSKALIEARVGERVDGIAYPDGRRGTYDDATVRVARRVGLRWGCIAEHRTVAPGADVYRLGRVPVGDVPMSVFMADLLGYFSA